MDNLQSTTYDVFEKDPVKYERYEQAVYRALCDRPEGLDTCVLPRDLYLRPTLPDYRVICVVGAGRGPLVTRCRKAMTRADRSATIIAVEKNPNAFVTYVFQVGHCTKASSAPACSIRTGWNGILKLLCCTAT